MPAGAAPDPTPPAPLPSALAGRRDPGGVLAAALARARVDVEADLVVEGPPGAALGALRVRGAPGGLTVTLPHLGAARALRAYVRASPGRAEGVLVLDALLRRTGLTVGMVVRTHEVARLGAGATPGMVSRFAGIGPLDLRAAGVLRALVTRGARR